MERDIVLNGTQGGWVRTGLAVRRGEIFDVQASGEIQFAWGGWGRGPDGTDHTGRSEAPAIWPCVAKQSEELVHAWDAL